MSLSTEAPVRNVIEQYMNATFQGDIERLKECFHPKAVMNGFLGGDLLMGTPEPFFQDIGNKPSMASGKVPYKGKILSVDVQEGIACVTFKETGFPGNISFINFFHLLMDKGEWKIVSKTFTSLSQDGS